jgi:cobyrinic acid a,c-diamide synthase
MPGFSRFLIAAPHSGAGKTTATLGLLRALHNRGLRTQPFKCGPDFIDPIHHTTAAGRQSINLDPYMMSSAHIRDLYHQYTADADVAITEGVMGLFDGSQKREGSSADLAVLLQLPVILILNAKAMAYSAAALLHGLKTFDPDLIVAGVIFNFVETESHYRLLSEACDDVGVVPLGHLPTNKALQIPSRHLGLDTANADEAITAAARHVGNHLDLAAILAATATSRPPASQPPFPDPAPLPHPGSKTILVARDAAFHFLYPENLRRLQTYGKLHFFSPLTESRLPPGDVLYLPGGYPELFLEQLAGNESLKKDIRHFANTGGRILAECGGMMFLGRTITDETGRSWPMAGVLDIETSMHPKKLSLGYRTLTINDQTLKGHEFHYSQFSGDPKTTTSPPLFVRNARGHELPVPVFYQPNIFASYMHFYWGESPGLLERWLTG